MRILLATALVWLTSQAAAKPLEERVLPCWNPPIGVPTEDVEIVFDLIIDENGYLEDAAMVSVEPTGPKERELVMSAFRAMNMCAPYDERGRIQVRMAFPPPIDPFNPIPK